MGDDHPETLIAMNNLAVLLEAQGKLEEAESLHREAVERYRRVLGNEHESTLRSINNLSVVLQKSGKLAAAEPLRREALEGRRKSLGDDHPDTLRSINSMGGLLVAQGRIAEAEPIFEELYRRAAVAQLPPKDAARYVCQYGTCLRKLGKYAEALEPLSIAYDRMKTSGQEKHELMRAVVAALADASERTNRPAEAARWAEELAALKATTRPAPDLRPPSTAPAVP